MFSFTAIVAAIKLLIKGVITYGILAKIWLEMTGHAFFDVLLYVMDFDRRMRKVKEWIKKLIE